MGKRAILSKIRNKTKAAPLLMAVALVATLFAVVFTSVMPQAANAAGTKRCADGTEIPATDECFDTSGGLQTCPDKSVIPKDQTCPAANTGTAEADQDADSPTLECEATLTNPISWLACPVIVGLQEGVELTNNAIDALMTVDTTGAKGTVFSDEFHTAWGQFRIFAIGFIVIAGLIMLASQAFGFELFDAYTVRKVLPRLIIAIIFISISWDLMKFLINLTNDIGNSIRAIIYQPFKGISPIIQTGNWSKFVIFLVEGAALVAFGLWALASFLLTAGLAVLVGFLILLVRQLIIIFLVMVSPIAIACYVLPNTQKAFEFWKGTLLSMLLAFPIISAFIAIGRVFAVTANSSDAGGTLALIAQIEAFVAFFLPYFMMPFAFKMAGGAISTLTGMLNDRGKGVFDGLKNYRSGKRAENFAHLKTGQRFSGGNYVGRKLNAASVVMTGGGSLNSARGAQKRHQLVERTAMEIQKSANFQAISQYDDALKAGTYNSISEARRAGVSEAGIQAWQAAGFGFGDHNAQYAAARQRVSTGTGYSNMEDMERTFARVSHGNQATIGALAGFGNSETKKVGRPDLAPGAGVLTNRVQQRAGVSTSPINTPDGPQQRVSADYAANEAWNSVSLYQHANSKPANIQSHINHFQGVISNPNATAQQKTDAAVFFTELKSIMPNASGGVRNNIVNAMTANNNQVQDFLNSRVRTGEVDPVTGQADSVTLENSDAVRQRARSYQRQNDNEHS